jgi:hypothetical protein
VDFCMGTAGPMNQQNDLGCIVVKICRCRMTGPMWQSG